MSKETIIIQCRDCNREVYRRESGYIVNDNGLKGTVAKKFTIDKRKCPYCRGIKTPEVDD
jgi:hypothetical protein